jgi:hypothetical protein
MEVAFRANRFRACFTDAENQTALLAIPGALGLLDEGTLRLEGVRVRVLELTDSPAAASPPRDLKPLSFLTLGRPQGEAERFIAFATSSAVADLLQLGGYLP